MTVEIAVDPDLSLIFDFDFLHEIFDGYDFWVKLTFRVDPLSVEIDSRQRIPVIPTNHTVRVHAGDEDEGVEASEILCFPTVTRNKIIDTFKHFTARRFSGMDAGCDQYNLVFTHGFLVAAYNNLIKRNASNCFCQLLPLVINAF